MDFAEKAEKSKQLIPKAIYKREGWNKRLHKSKRIMKRTERVASAMTPRNRELVEFAARLQDKTVSTYIRDLAVEAARKEIQNGSNGSQGKSND